MPRNCGAQDVTITNVEKITTTNEKGPFESAASINQEKTKVRNEEINMILILRLPSMVEAARVKHIKAGHASTEIKSRVRNPDEQNIANADASNAVAINMY